MKRDHRKFIAKAKERVAIARGLDAKLDAQEEATDAAERAEASQMKAQLSLHISEARESDLSAKKNQAYAVREGTRQAIMESTVRTMRESAERARQKREEAERWRTQKQEAEDEYMREARNNRATALQTRVNTKAAKEEMARTKAAEAANIRKWENAEWNVERDIASINIRKAHVQDQYATRYVEQEAASEWNLSPLKRLHAAARWAMDALT